MPTDTIRKSGIGFKVAPRLTDYAAECRSFSWSAARAALDGLPDGGLNIAHEAIDRHVQKGQGARIALRWLDKQGAAHDFSYASLRELTNRFANVLAALGIGRGDAVFALMGRMPALYIGALGTLKNGSVFCPMFSAFGPEPIHQRMSIGRARVLVTTAALYARKVAGLRASLPDLAHVLIADLEAYEPAPEGTLNLQTLMAEASEAFTIAATQPEDLALLHFTSGTTGRPKGAMHVHEAVVAHQATAGYALDLRPEDVFWCTADPGVLGQAAIADLPIAERLLDHPKGMFDPGARARLEAFEGIEETAHLGAPIESPRWPGRRPPLLFFVELAR